MNKNIFILITCVISFLCSCTDTIWGIEPVKGEPTESQNIIMDSLTIYKIQTDKNVMLNNLIHYKFGKYVLDLTLDDAKDLGISEMLYNQVFEHINQLNNDPTLKSGLNLN